jgi:sterol desaturase/sphingolipid hydroxylase (fatty acid hydroxylase superfamily)
MNWVWQLITFSTDWDQNYFYGLIIVSLLVWGLEMMFPWRKGQSLIRKDFWLDGFYMFFNFFIFSIVISGVYAIIEMLCVSNGLTINSISLLSVNSLPNWAFMLVFFILNDFVQWFTHVMLHKFPVLWRFHKVHHSVQEMGFAAHLRYHWMENIFYKPLKTFAVMILVGAEPEHAFFLHFFTIIIGHLNHANVRITWGPLKYVFNNSVMHLYHHAKVLPNDRAKGVNFAISLSVWDYLFKTNYIPQDKEGDYDLGFEGIENYPKGFFRQLVSGFRKE